MMSTTRLSGASSRRAFLALALLCGQAWADVPDDMKSLIEQGRFADAFDLGLRNERLAGEPRYDYFFGVAAIDSGRASLGVLALERVLLDNPDNDLARLELARGYFVIKDYERAREEFEFMRKKNLPAGVRASVERYLNSIREADVQFRTVRRTFFEYGVGHHNNINSATTATTVDIPSFGPINLGTSSRPTPSALYQLAAGTQIQGPVRTGLKYLVGLEANHRGYAQKDTFDQSSLTAMGGLEFDLGGSTVKASGFFSNSSLSYKRFRDTTGLVADWSRPLDKETQVRTSLSYSQLRHGAGNEGRDGDVLSASAGMNHFLGMPWRVSLDLDANIGQEQNIRNRNDFSRNTYGARSGLTFYPAGRWMGNTALAFTSSTYKDKDLLLLAPRSDALLALDMGLQYQLTPGWIARSELSVLSNQSNLKLYNYESVQVMMKMRYEWK